MTPSLPTILSAADRGERIASIAAAAGVSVGRVYAILREHRPERTRSRRTVTSTVPLQVRALYAAGTKPRRIAELLGVSRAYVYAILDTKEQS